MKSRCGFKLEIYGVVGDVHGQAPALTRLFRDWQFHSSGAKVARLLALEAGQDRAKRMAEITAHLDALVYDEFDRQMRQNQRYSGQMQIGETKQRDRGG